MEPTEYETLPVPTYEEILLDGIMSAKHIGKTTEYSILFNSVMSTLTAELHKLYYNDGAYIGGSLYDICRKNGHYVLYKESVADLVSFLENAGFSRITYHIYPDRIDIKFNNRDKTYLGRNMHVFEAGIMSGFLSTGAQQRLNVKEVSCSNNGSDLCHFMTSEDPPAHEPDAGEVLSRFAGSITDRIRSKAGAFPSFKENFAEEYLELSSQILSEKEHAEHMHRIVRHLGSTIASETNLETLNRKALKNIERAYALLGLGKITTRYAKGIDIELQFDRLKAKKEFVDISIAFLEGLIGSSISGADIKTNSAKRNKSYVVRIKSK
jgi:predicted hydrocarbon binding protein